MLAPAHPLAFTPDGSLPTESDEAVIRQHVAQIAGTNGATALGPQGELPWAPEFGGNVDHLRFAALGDLLNEAVAARVVGSVAEWEPRARITGTRSTSDISTNTASITVVFGSPSIARDSVTVTR